MLCFKHTHGARAMYGLHWGEAQLCVELTLARVFHQISLRSETMLATVTRGLAKRDSDGGISTASKRSVASSVHSDMSMAQHKAVIDCTPRQTLSGSLPGDTVEVFASTELVSHQVFRTHGTFNKHTMQMTLPAGMRIANAVAVADSGKCHKFTRLDLVRWEGSEADDGEAEPAEGAVQDRIVIGQDSEEESVKEPGSQDSAAYSNLMSEMSDSEDESVKRQGIDMPAEDPAASTGRSRGALPHPDASICKAAKVDWLRDQAMDFMRGSQQNADAVDLTAVLQLDDTHSMGESPHGIDTQQEAVEAEAEPTEATPPAVLSSWQQLEA